MVLISLKDYAKNNNITYEAVRQQVKRYKNELGSHIIIDGRQQFLDEEAVSFLDDKRQKNPVTIIQQSKDEALEALQIENKNLLIKVAELSNWKADNAVAIAEANQRQVLLEERKQRIDALEAQNADLSNEKEKLVSDIENEKKTSRELSEELTAIKSKWWYKLFGGKK